jgi:V/A-type H+-transporting ATPase subunit E
VDGSETTSHEVLRDEILADAQRQATRVIRKAEREAKAILDKATSESQEERDSKLAAAQAEADRKRMLVLATVPVEIGRMRAARIEKELLALRDQVRSRLRDRKGFDYRETLEALAAEALAQMEGDTFILALSERDHKQFAARLAEAARKRAERPQVTVTVDDQPAPIAGGVVVRDPAGRQVWDNSLEARLDRLWPLLRSQIAQHLGFQASTHSSGGQT